MVAIALIAVFLLVGWIMLAIPLSEYESTTLILCIAGGLVAVVIVASSMILKKLNSIYKLLMDKQNTKVKKLSENNVKEDKENN